MVFVVVIFPLQSEMTNSDSWKVKADGIVRYYFSNIISIKKKQKKTKEKCRPMASIVVVARVVIQSVSYYFRKIISIQNESKNKKALALSSWLTSSFN